MDWLAQSPAALLALAVVIGTVAFLVHMSFRTRPDARMAFLTGLLRGAGLEDQCHNSCSTPSIFSEAPPATKPAFSR